MINVVQLICRDDVEDHDLSFIPIECFYRQKQSSQCCNASLDECGNKTPGDRKPAEFGSWVRVRGRR